MSITVDAIVGSTGLELKVDPGVPYVYAGFAGARCAPLLCCALHLPTDRFASCAGVAEPPPALWQQFWHALSRVMAPCYPIETSAADLCLMHASPKMDLGLSFLKGKKEGSISLFLCAGLMITTLVSYLSHSQIWALQAGGTLHIGGRTNRAAVTFQSELDELLAAMPEHLPAPAQAQQQLGASGAAALQDAALAEQAGSTPS